MVAESKYTEKEGEAKRDESLDLGMIDSDYLERKIQEDIEDFNDTHSTFFEDRQEWILALRDLKHRYREGFFEGSSDLHIPYSLIMSKAMHARIFQVFSQRSFFSVESNNETFADSEETVKFFMDWVLDKWLNRGRGKQDVVDAWITDILEEGSGILKLYWDRWEHKFLDLEVTTEDIPDLNILAGEDVKVEETTQQKTKIEDVERHLKESAPAAGTVSVEDFFMPPGQLNVQQSPWVAHRVYLRDEDLKMRAKQNKFDSELVEEAIERRINPRDDYDSVKEGTRRERRRMEGVDEEAGRNKHFDGSTHAVYEWYGRAYVKKKVGEDDFLDIKEMPEDVVVWYHAGLRRILGWTYLHRISPSGRRPFYKSDFMPSKERAVGVGIAEMLNSLNQHIDGVHNLKMDNGVLSSLQFGFYRSGSTFKPDTFRLTPGELIPVEDTNDVKLQNIPYLGQFGENEELTLTGYGEKLLAVNDINLGNLTGRGVAGALRNATGANFVDRQANIQLHPHLDRIAREVKDFLKDLFILTRSRMKPELYFRVTGEDGRGYFGDIKREDLRGDYDFLIDVDLAASSEAEKQQRVSLMLQTLLNPTFLQTGILQPGNLYEVLKEFLIRHQVRNPDKFITKPMGYAGPPLTTEQRIMKILLDRHDDPPIEATVRPEEDHERSLEKLGEFEESNLFGTLDQDALAAYQALKSKHTEFMGLNSGGMKGMPNITGTQMPGEGGLQALGGGAPDANASEGGPLGSPMGEVNGPVQ